MQIMAHIDSLVLYIELLSLLVLDESLIAQLLLLLLDLCSLCVSYKLEECLLLGQNYFLVMYGKYSLQSFPLLSV